MYRFILMTFFAFLAHNALAQRTHCPYPQHELNITYGYMSAHQLGAKYIDKLAAKNVRDATTGDDVSVDMMPIGPLQLTYKFFFKERASVGASVVYSFNRITTTHGAVEQEYDYHTLALTPRLDFYYIRQPNFAFYGSAEVGVNLNLLSTSGGQSSEPGIAYQFSPLCFRFGKKIGFVLELGFGTNGVASGGLGYRHYHRAWTFY